MSACAALLVDLGNTRVKWAPLVAGRPGRQRAAAHADWSDADFSRELCTGLPRGTPVLVVSVASDTVNRRLARAVTRSLGGRPAFVHSARRAAGVRNGYREPWRLGADRWVAVLGAYHLFRPSRHVCVIDAGTALTIDLVDDAGDHRGGVIVPGPELMVSSLLAGTSGIRRRVASTARVARVFFARDTRAGLERGAEQAAGALVERAVHEARRLLGGPVTVVLTGGASSRLQRSIEVRHRLVPDLVLRGLAVLLHDGSRDIV